MHNKARSKIYGAYPRRSTLKHTSHHGPAISFWRFVNMHAQALLHSQLDKVLIGARQTWLDVIGRFVVAELKYQLFILLTEDAKYQKIVSEIETLENKLLENWVNFFDTTS